MDKYIIEIPEFCLVAMVGGTSSGKSSFALKHFKSTEVLSSDFFRGMVCDDENSQSVSGDAFDAPDCIRFSYATSEDKITEAMRRVKECIAALA